MLGHDPFSASPISANSTTAASSTPADDAQLSEPFTTRLTRGKHRLADSWIAALAPAQQAPAFPFAAVFGVQRVRRATTTHRLVTVAPLHWQYIAPTVAAILPTPKVIRVDFRTRLRVTPEHNVYPPTTGPPVFEFAAVAPSRAFKRRGNRNRFVLDAEVFESVDTPQTTPAVYPSFLATGHHDRKATRYAFRRELTAPVFPYQAPTTSDDGNLAEPFTTRRIAPRRHLRDEWMAALSAPTPPLVTTFIDAQKFAKAFARRDTRRTMIVLTYPPVYPETPPTIPAPDDYIVRSRHRGRR